MIEVAADQHGRKVPFWTVPRLAFSIGGRFNEQLREASELLPRYGDDNVFDSSRFTTRFPGFAVTTYAEGISTLVSSQASSAAPG